VLILDEQGSKCPPGTPGMVWFRGATNFEYFNDPAKTAERVTPPETRAWSATSATWTTAGTSTSPTGRPT
jgi:hypothetical protein